MLRFQHELVAFPGLWLRVRPSAFEDGKLVLEAQTRASNGPLERAARARPKTPADQASVTDSPPLAVTESTAAVGRRHRRTES
ncbi:hypothetical protein HPB47_010761 [Ixodes persulcatus]|uniref:Uncharacterized protein n=1 Tax=Ixodes persulcatus TaxID=34615 RepID=A0AC60NYG1_IXOPE|nr:hypothetical protein HPB47_010761 [Ixodes persulcatus]